MRASVYIATSVDGFIAREDGSIDWLPVGDSNSAEDYGYQDFINSVDALVMGRNTYELIRSFDPWPYGDKPVIVLTTVTIMSGSPVEIVQGRAERGYKHLYIDGGKTIQDFIREGMIQTLIITRIPVLIGSGLPLFGAVPNDIKLLHRETIQFENGLVQSRYEILGEGE